MEKRTKKTADAGRIAITGPESTGKSQLSEQLALHYRTEWVPEYAREYLTKIGRPYVYEDLRQIAKGQHVCEELVSVAARNWLFCDTDFILIYIWSMFKYNKCDPWIEGLIAKHKYDLFLLCDIDLPWTPDPLREHPGKRQELFSLYMQELESRGFPYKVVSGFGAERLNNAISFIDNLGK